MHVSPALVQIALIVICNFGLSNLCLHGFIIVLYDYFEIMYLFSITESPYKSNPRFAPNI